MPPEWLPLLQVIIGNIGSDDSESSILYQLLSSVIETGDEKVAVHIPYIVSSVVGAVSKCTTPNLDPWPQVCTDFSWLIVGCNHFKWLFPRSDQSHNIILILNLKMLTADFFLKKIWI